MARDPMYSDYLQFNPTFKWGGRSWGANDQGAFEKYLRRRGIKPQQWYRRHATAAKVFDPTEQRIYSMFQPQLTAIDAERKRAAELWGRRMTNLSGFTQALMPYLQQVPGAIMTPYREGAAGMESLGRNVGGSLNADSAAEAAGANAVLSAIGAPEGQQLSGGDAGGVLAGLGGMEGELMRATGGAYGAAASQLPKTASIEAQLMMKDLLMGAAEADRGFSQDVLGVLQGLPGAREELRGQARKERMEQQAFALEKLESERKWYLQQAALASARGDDRRAEHYLKLAQERERRMQLGTMGLDAMGNPKPGYKIDPQTGLVVPVKDPKKGSQASTVPGTPAWRAAQVKAVGNAQPKIEKDVAAYFEASGYDPTQMGPPAPATSRMIAQLKKDLWEKYNYLATTPTAKKRLRKAIELAVRRYRPEKGGGSSGSSAKPGGSLPSPEK